jgi:hypothetical protein
MTLPPAGVDRDSTSYGVYDFGAGRFREVNADSGTGIRLESSKRESQNEVPHKGARINPSSCVPLCHNVTKRIPQGEVSAAPETLVKEVSLKGGTNYACKKNVTEFDAAIKANVILRVHLQTVSKKR